MRRVIARGGRGRAHLGGGLATAADLTSTVAGLIDIASQHDQQSLTDPESQLAILDAFAENQALRDEMTAAYAARAEAAAALAAFSADARARGEREDLLRFQLGGAGGGRAGARRGRARSPPSASDSRGPRGSSRRLARGEETLYAGDGAVAERLAGVSRELTPLAALDPALGAARRAARPTRRRRSRTSRAISAATRAASGRTRRDSRRSRSGSSCCRGSAASTAERSPDLAAKQIGAAAPSWPSSARSRRGWPRGRRRRARPRRARPRRRRRSARRVGRRPAASKRRSNAVLRELGFASARLPVAIEARELGPNGADRVRLLFAPNPGEEARPLAKIASGGELSRVMLAVKQALARTDEVLTYVFDEVDAGIGGGTAEVDRAKAEAPGGRAPGHRHHPPPPGRRLRRRPRAGHQDRRARQDARRDRPPRRRRPPRRDRAHAGGRGAVGPGDGPRGRDAPQRSR